MQIIIDIETVPSQAPQAREQVRATLRPPGTLKKPETIAAWWANEAQDAAEEAYRKQALDGGLHGEVISIACTSGDAQWVRCRAQGESEALLLTEFACTVWGWLDADTLGNHTPEPYFVAHNAAFDLGFLWRRAIVKGVPFPFRFPSPAARPGKDYGCTMATWAGYGNRVSLDALCSALNVPSPKDEGMDGAKVYDAWVAGQHEQIAAYNLRDTLATAEVWSRLQGHHAQAAA